MIYQELNPVGNFAPWEASKLSELERNQVSNSLGQKLLFENKALKVWEIFLQPNERMGFRRISNSYTVTSMCEGLAVSRFSDGSIYLYRFQENDTRFVPPAKNKVIQDLENIGESPIYFHIMEFKSMILALDCDIKSIYKSK
ncbi:hypothetical protein D1013_06640 [Euzebyella marina]|uniref:Uncharacterized protein n=1 Tax=Euzebyella marina TaxID=1761453 RepID=A0A3G2L4G0_9FLAO|nr:hypothetical protein [Euzebyella marina]AYN67066.1 hypothetical protein D1013_06640 [Euzebyella marina]